MTGVPTRLVRGRPRIALSSDPRAEINNEPAPLAMLLNVIQIAQSTGIDDLRRHGEKDYA